MDFGRREGWGFGWVDKRGSGQRECDPTSARATAGAVELDECVVADVVELDSGRTSSPSAAKAFGIAFSRREFLREDDVWSVRTFEDELCDLVVVIDCEWGVGRVVEEDLDFASIVGVDDPPLDCNLFCCEATSWCYSGIEAVREFTCEAGGDDLGGLRRDGD